MLRESARSIGLYHEIQKTEKEYVSIGYRLDYLREELSKTYVAHFKDFYKQDPINVYESYAKRIASFCFIGRKGEGMEWWLPPLRGEQKCRYKPAYEYCVVMRNDKVFPTQIERDAFWVIHEKEMHVPF